MYYLEIWKFLDMWCTWFRVKVTINARCRHIKVIVGTLPQSNSEGMFRQTFLICNILVSFIAAYQRCPVKEGQRKGTVNDRYIVETSGLAYSRRAQGVLWVHNDSGGSTWINAISEQGTDKYFIYLKCHFYPFSPFTNLRSEACRGEVAWHQM